MRLTRPACATCLAVVFAVAGCSNSTTETTPRADNSTSIAADTTEVTSPRSTEAESCAPLKGKQALEQFVGEVPPPFPDSPPGPENQWSLDSSVEHYDPCAPLSWITLRIDASTVSSPYQIMFFHNGEYVGPATQQAFDYSPAITELGPAMVQVTFRWAQEGEANVNASGVATSMYAWNEQAGRLERQGELPVGAMSAQ